MTEQEIRRALAICEEVNTWGPATLREMTKREDVFIRAALNESTGYAATLRALLEARELLLGCDAAMVIALNQHGLSTITTVVLESCQAKVRAFLAEGE